MTTISKKNWTRQQEIAKETIQKLAQELQVSELFVRVCFARGWTTAEDIRRFITIDETWFHDPFLLYDMEKAVARIVAALEKSEKITVYGDYDADGMTSTALLVETLDSLGAHVDYYLPNRFVEGYGPDQTAFEKIINNGTTLILTVDNGVTGHEVVEFAQSQNVDVIVTDHHEFPEVLPPAYAVIHPKHPKGQYPFADLAGVGVALKVATALLGELPIEMLDLAAIGTVADLVSLTDENRALVFYGLQMLEETQRAGLTQLLKIIDKKPTEITEETISFQIAPRLNAVGRLGDATPCVELLLTHDVDRAGELAEYVDQKNEERKEIVEEMTSDVLASLKQQTEKSEVIVLADESWHQGVLGIVASHVVEQTEKATLLFTIDVDSGLAKGSARSIDSLNLHKAFTTMEGLFEQFGGHHMAAGMSAKIEDLPNIQKELSEYVNTLEAKDSLLQVDAYASLAELSIEAIKELNLLRPFGVDNEKPIIACEQVAVLEKRKVGAEGDHLKLLVGQEGRQLDIISFQNGKISDLLFEQQEITVAGYVGINEWNGFTKPQMQMIDADIPGPLLVDQRSNQLTKTHFRYKMADYIFYTEELYRQAKKIIPSTANAVLINTEKQAKDYTAQQEVVIVECPLSIEQFKNTVENNSQQLIRCYFYKQTHTYLTGLPTRSDFTKVYKYFAAHKNIDLQNEGHRLVQALNLESAQVFLIVRVFLEAKFVIIDNGVLDIITNPEKMNIQETKAFQEAEQQLEAEELFLYSSFKEVIQSTAE